MPEVASSVVERSSGVSSTSISLSPSTSKMLDGCGTGEIASMGFIDDD